MRTTKKLLEFSVRRSRRMSRHGRLFEAELEKYLEELKSRGDIDDFARHQPNSPEDCDGCDFTISKRIKGEMLVKSFGVTISLHSWRESQLRHPQAKQFCFPIGTKKETIVKRILELVRCP